MAQQPQQHDSSQPAGEADLRERIARQMAMRRQARQDGQAGPAPQADQPAQPPSPPAPQGQPGDGDSPSLQDIIAQKRQKVAAELLARRQEQQAAAEAEAQAAAEVEALAAESEAAQAADAPDAPADRPPEAAPQRPAEQQAAAPAKIATAPPVESAEKYRRLEGGSVSLQEIIARKHGEAAAQAPQGSQPAAHAPAPGDPAAAYALGAALPPGRRSTFAAALILLNTLLLAVLGGLLAYVLTHRGGPSAADAAATALLALERHRPPAQPQRPAADAPLDAEYVAALNGPPPTAAAVAAVAAAPSWAEAEQAFQAGDHNAAVERYGRLLLASRRIPSETTAGEFFSYRIAQSVWSLGRPEAARRVLTRLTAAESPAVRAAAHAALAELAEASGEMLAARMLAYRAIAALEAMDSPVAGVEADCDYLAARAATRKVNALCSAEEAVPWSRLRRADPFAGRGEPALRRLLEEGAAAVRAADGAPLRIEKTDRGWQVAAGKATVEDLLSQFAAAAGLDVRWRGVDAAARRRGVNVCFRRASAQRLIESVCGMTGLVARFGPEGVTVCDAAAAGVLSEQKSLLGSEAASAWRRFVLRHAGDARVAEGGMALAALHEWAGQAADALRQYQLVARRFSQDVQIAPRALLRSAVLRSALRDYAGARSDLHDLLDLFPHYGDSARVYLELGRVSLKCGRLEEALNVFTRLHTFDAPADIRREACLQAAECCLRKNDAPAAGRWAEQALALLKDPSPPQIVAGCELLGRCEAARGQHATAIAAFRRALAANPARGRFVAIGMDLARSQAAAEDFAGALHTLGRLEQEEIPPTLLVEYLMLGSSVYRAMGLPDRARALIRRKGPAVTDKAAQVRLAMEQARCLAEEGDLAAARQGMSEALGRMGAGEETWRAALDLAELCLKAGDAEQAVVLAEDVLRGRCGEELRRRALGLVARACLKQGQYEKAVRALTALAEVKVAAAKDLPAAGKQAEVPNPR